MSQKFTLFALLHRQLLSFFTHLLTVELLKLHLPSFFTSATYSCFFFSSFYFFLSFLIFFIFQYFFIFNHKFNENTFRIHCFFTIPFFNFYSISIFKQTVLPFFSTRFSNRLLTGMGILNLARFLFFWLEHIFRQN